MDQIIKSYQLSLKYIKRYPKFWLYFFLRTITAVIDVVVPIIVGYIIILFTNNTNITQIYTWMGVLIVLLIVSPILDKIAGLGAWFISFRIAHDFRRDAIKKLRHTGLSFWQNHERGNVLKIIDQAFEHLIYLSGIIVHSYVPFLGRIIGIIISTAFIDPVISLFFLIDAIFFFVNLKIYVPLESSAGLLERKAQESVHGRISEYLTNYKTVVYLNLFDRQEKEIFQYNEAAYTTYTKRETFSAWKWYVNNQIHAICIAAIICYSVWQVIIGHLQIGLLTTIVFFSLKIVESLTELVWNLSELIKYSNSIQRYTDTFADIGNNIQEIVDHKIKFERLLLKDVSMQQIDRETLRSVNLQIERGQKIAIVGFTGSGKTTLIDIILKAITTYGGEILINEFNYHDVSVGDVAKIYSIVPQEVQLFRGTLKDNILINTETSDHDLNKVINTACLGSLVEKLPERLESQIQEGASNISGGERQRIGIARALLQQHPILILDEATASLDPKTERDVITNIIKFYPEITILFVSHKYSLLNLFDHIIVMNEGSIIEQDSFENLVKKGGLFKDLFDASQIQDN